MGVRKFRRPGFSVAHNSWYIPLTQGVVALVDGALVPRLSEHCWCARNSGTTWVAFRSYRRHSGIYSVLSMHREILTPKPGEFVDHRIHFPIEAKVIDNRRENLRCCSRAENQRNRRVVNPNGASRFKGVVRNTNSAHPWAARISHKNRRQRLGVYDTEEDAARAYDEAAKRLHGEFARTNASMGLFEVSNTGGCNHRQIVSNTNDIRLSFHAGNNGTGAFARVQKEFAGDAKDVCGC